MGINCEKLCNSAYHKQSESIYSLANLARSNDSIYKDPLDKSNKGIQLEYDQFIRFSILFLPSNQIVRVLSL